MSLTMSDAWIRVQGTWEGREMRKATTMTAALARVYSPGFSMVSGLGLSRVQGLGSRGTWDGREMRKATTIMAAQAELNLLSPEEEEEEEEEGRRKEGGGNC
eukprot:1101448-Rhodomonas_salina.1